MSNILKLLFFALTAFGAGCAQARTANIAAPLPAQAAQAAETVKAQNPGRVIQVLVELCDNVNQSIVPVPAALGNGKDARENLYWGRRLRQISENKFNGRTESAADRMLI